MGVHNDIHYPFPECITAFILPGFYFITGEQWSFEERTQIQNIKYRVIKLRLSKKEKDISLTRVQAILPK